MLTNRPRKLAWRTIDEPRSPAHLALLGAALAMDGWVVIAAQDYNESPIQGDHVGQCMVVPRERLHGHEQKFWDWLGAKEWLIATGVRMRSDAGFLASQVKEPRKHKLGHAWIFSVKMKNASQERQTNLRFRFIARGVARRFQQRIIARGNLQSRGTPTYETGFVFDQLGRGSLTARAKFSVGGSNPATLKVRVR